MNRRKFVLSLLSVICLLCSGCMQFSVPSGGNEDEMTKGGDVYYGSYYDFWWGDSPEKARRKDMEARRDETEPRTIHQVIYSSNYLYTFVSFVSFGLFVPIDVRWYLNELPAEEYSGPIRKKEEK